MAGKGWHAERLGRLRKALGESKLDGVAIVPGPNMRYFTGVNSLLLERPFLLLVPKDGEAHLLAPALESGPYRTSPMPMEVHSWTDSQGSSTALKASAEGARVRGRWGVEGKVPYLFFEKLEAAAKARYVGAENVLQGLREIKDKGEEALLKKAGRILGDAFERFPEFIKEGETEAELARKASGEIYSRGGTKVDDLLVQSGARAADPHALPSSKKIARGESIIIDIGSTYEGYYADITRTFCVGKSAAVEKVYDRVLEAEEKAIAASKAGVTAGKVDGTARGVLLKAGMAKYFIHRTGHGLGLEVHEAPYIVEGSREKLRDGMCFTVEPGVYMKGSLGVRIEDDVLMKGGRGVELTKTPKEYGWWA